MSFVLIVADLWKRTSLPAVNCLNTCRSPGPAWRWKLTFRSGAFFPAAVRAPGESTAAIRMAKAKDRGIEIQSTSPRGTQAEP